MLRGYRPSYREALLCIRGRLEVQCPSGLETQACVLLRPLPLKALSQIYYIFRVAISCR